MSTCRQARRWMERAFDGRLAVDEDFLLEEHAGSCARCRVELQAQALLLDGLTRLPEPPAERVDVERCLAGIHEQLEREGAEVPAPVAGRWVRRAAAALLVGAGVAWFAHVTGRAPDAPEAPADLPVVVHVPAPTERVVEDGVPSVIVHPLQDLSATNLDVDRHAAVQARVRVALEQAALAHLGDDDVLAFITSFEAATGDLIAGDWPMARLVAGLVRDQDSTVAQAACRYTGRRATRLGIARLEEALDSDSRLAATRALVDAGPLGVDGLGRALWDPELTGVALRAANGFDPTQRLSWCVEALEHAPEDFGQRMAGAGHWIDLVAGTGRAGAEELLQRLTDPRLRRDEVIEGLIATGLGAELLVDRIKGRLQSDEVLALLDAIERLRPEDAFAFVREQAWSGPDRARAAQVLVSYPGVRALQGLLELDEGRRLEVDVLAETWSLALDLEGDRTVLLAIEQRERGDRTGSRRLLEGLALSAHPRAVPALLELARRGSLASDDRARALLLVAELGGPEHVPTLVESFDRLTQRDRDHAAACLFALHRLGGAEAVLRALDGASDRTRERVLVRLEGDVRATSLLLLARELEPVLASHEALTWKESR